MARISKAQKECNHREIVKAASERFRSEGVGAVGIAQLMSAAGMTHGGFYNHFASKDELAVEVCGAAFGDSHALLAKELDGGAGAIDRVLADYLCREHRDAPDGGCPSAALAIDAARLGEAIQAAFGAGVEGYLAGFADALKLERAELDEPEVRERAIALLSGMVGAILLSRAVADPALSDELLDSTRRALLALVAQLGDE